MCVPESGVYGVRHRRHRLPVEVTLLKGQLFPKCAACEESVYFTAVRLAPWLEHSGPRIAIYELPAEPDREPALCRRKRLR